MSEIKHSFQSGKMNKDFDERLVPQGQYRDALNIEVSTTDASDAGTAQNLYGNIERPSYLPVKDPTNFTVNFDSEESYFVGSVADEKTNNSYFLVASPRVSLNTARLSLEEDVTYKDMIIRYNSNTKKVYPVLTDVFRIEFPMATHAEDLTVNSSSINPYDSLALPGAIIGRLRPGMSIDFVSASGTSLISQYPGAYPLNNMPAAVTIREIDNGAVYFDRQVVGSLEFCQFLIVEAARVLNFSSPFLNSNYSQGASGPNKPHHITGINIINNLLLWTDGFSEPKKINLDRLKSIKNSELRFDTHTNLLLDDPSNTSGGLVELKDIDGSTHSGLIEDHITVIRRAPRTAPKLEMSIFENAKERGFVATCVFDFTIDAAGVDNPLNVGQDVFIDDINDDNTLSEVFGVGDILRFVGAGQALEVIAEVISIQNSNDRHKVKIIKIDPDITSTHLNWDVKLVQKKPIFETKLGRFSFRYKYQDGEFSSFAPWSELAFLPGKLDFIPIKGYNLGMVNNLRNLKITDFIVDDAQRPDDVVAVDILWKDTVSPNVYVVKSIKRGYNSEWDDKSTGGNSGVLDITTEMIHRTVPSSQMLRAWDNVPLVAKAQEVTGNRVVYGNYEQNYDINQVVSAIPSITTIDHIGRVDSNIDAVSNENPQYLMPLKSVKSLRSYKVGVVFGDKFGRETPVIGVGGKTRNVSNPGKYGSPFTSQPDSVEVQKQNSWRVNKLSAQLEWTTPHHVPSDWMEYYKYYVKETTNEYYNLVMDRWYPAEDGNIWLSFQSADRNKLDIETYLILKNEHGTEDAVEEDARYKVLAISNEAPDFIKNTNRIIGQEQLDDSTYSMSETMIVDMQDNFYDRSFKDVKFEGIGWARIVGELNGVARFSDWKRIARMNDTDKFISVVTSFGETAGMNTEFGFGVGTTPTISVEVRDSVPENKPEFEGRFFVKVFKDIVLTNSVIGTDISASSYSPTNIFSLGYVSTSAANGVNPASGSSSLNGDYSVMTLPASGEWGGDSDTDYTDYMWNDDILSSGYTQMGLTSSAANKVKKFWAKYWDNNPSGNNDWFISNAHWAKHNECESPQYGPEDGLNSNGPDSIDNVSSITLSKINSAGNNGNEDPEGVMSLYNTLRQEGTLFRFPSDPGDDGYHGQPVIYVVRGFTDSVSHKNYHELPGEYPCVTCAEDGAGNNYCKRHSFDLHFSRYDDQTRGLNTSKWDPRSAVKSDGSSKLKLEVVKPYYDPSDIVQKIDGNAVWETEPKEDVGLDLYYEVTSAIPMRLENKNIESFAPVGSITSCDRLNAIANPTSMYDCYGDYQSGSVAIKTAVRDVIGLGDAAEVVGLTFPFAVYAHKDKGDVLSFTRPDGMVTEAMVIDHWHPLDSYNNKQQETVTYLGADSGGALVNITDTIPFSAATYKSSKEHTLTCSIDTVIATSAGSFLGVGTLVSLVTQITVVTASLPEGFNSDDNKIWQVSSNAIVVDAGTFTVRGGFTDLDNGTTKIDVKNCSSEVQDFTNQAVVLKFKEVTGYYRLNYKTYKSKTELPWFNCYSFGNGLESDRIRDDFNSPTIDNGCKVSTVLEDYSSEKRSSGLIWSGIYNSTSGVNNLNEFNMAESITKDLNPTYGSIQALKSRDTNMVAFCEDKVLKILANKDALFNADGSSNITASNAVLGDAGGLAGDYGISKNPESLAFDGYRMYFTDKQRGKVFRLSQDGLTPISDVNMSTYFRGKLKDSDELIGTFDTIKGEYNVTIKYPTDARGDDVPSTTISFNEKNKGWSSFKSFIPDTGLSINDEYITASHGGIWSHHSSDVDSSGNLIVNANNFYGEDYDSTIDVLFNDNPGAVKGFTAINYEGSQAKITEHDSEYVQDVNGNTLPSSDGEYYNLTSKDGWYVDSFDTDLQESKVVEFVDKEGKWFSFLDGITTTLDNLDTSEFTVQGIGVSTGAVQTSVMGCMDPTATNYNSNANVPALCEYGIPGCADSLAFNYNHLATYDDGSCIPFIKGCTDITAINYSPNANVDDGSCSYEIEAIVGCMDPTALNYNENATVPLPYVCEYEVVGCTDPLALNYEPLATSSDGSCEYTVQGCTDMSAANFSALATEDDGSCVDIVTGCMDVNSFNYDVNASEDDGSCYDVVYGCTDENATNYNALANTDDGSCIAVVVGCMDATANNYNPLANTSDSSCEDVVEGCMEPEAFNYNPLANSVNYTGCIPVISGCININASNYDPGANTDDGSCVFTPEQFSLTIKENND